jgi:hypothetical protein
VGTGGNTLAAADTQIAVVIHDFPGTVVAHLGGAHRDAAVAVHAFVFQYLDNGTKGRLTFHEKRYYKKFLISSSIGGTPQGISLSNRREMIRIEFNRQGASNQRFADE